MKRSVTKKPKSPNRAAAKELPRAASRNRRSASGESAGTDPKRVRAILAKLDEAYPEATCALVHESPFQLLIATILSAQCTDVRVNEVTKRSSGSMHAGGASRTRTRRNSSRRFARRVFSAPKRSPSWRQQEDRRRVLRRSPAHHGATADLPRRRAQNRQRRARHRVRHRFRSCRRHPRQRVAGRLDLSRHTDPKKIERDLMSIIPQDKWILFSHQLIWHGRRVCRARNPRCMECNLEESLHLER